jgi:hypothetical protein
MKNYHEHRIEIFSALSFRLILTVMVLLLFILIGLNCKESPKIVPSSYAFIRPAYGNIRLESIPDTLHFRLSKNTYNDIRAINYFEEKGNPYIAFYDRRSESVCIYNFSNQQRVKKIYLKEGLKDNKLYKVSVYVKNFDSIFITNHWVLYLIDSAGRKRSSVDFFLDNDKMGFIENQAPIVIKNNLVYMGVRPYIDANSFDNIKKWKVLYRFDFKKKKKKMYYSLPPVYQTNMFNDRFFSYSYCYNDNGNFIFSFPADTNIYETNLSDYHRAYYGKSMYQEGPILPLGKQAERDDEGRKSFLMRDTYGPLYYDPYNRRYLRVAWQKITEKEYENNLKRKQSLIIFDDKFRIIGESELSNNILMNTLFFAGKDKMYVRTNIEDENALHFLRLNYTQIQDNQPPLASSSSKFK